MRLPMTPEHFEQRMEFLLHSIESHDRQIAELVENGARLETYIKAQGVNIDKLIEASNRDGQHIRALARIAELHQERLDRIEGSSE